MKPLMLKIIFIGLFIIGLNGCYTIIWSPDMDFPTEENSNTTIYYGDAYYGPYYYFYDYPWWLDIVPPATSHSTGSRSDNHNNDGIRNLGERGTPNRIPELQPVSGNVPPVSTGNPDNSNNSGSSNTETSVRNSSSGSGTSGGRENSSNSGSTVRNNNGGRSSGGRR